MGSSLAILRNNKSYFAQLLLVRRWLFNPHTVNFLYRGNAIKRTYDGKLVRASLYVYTGGELFHKMVLPNLNCCSVWWQSTWSCPPPSKAPTCGTRRRHHPSQARWAANSQQCSRSLPESQATSKCAPLCKLGGFFRICRLADPWFGDKHKPCGQPGAQVTSSQHPRLYKAITRKCHQE